MPPMPRLRRSTSEIFLPLKITATNRFISVMASNGIQILILESIKLKTIYMHNQLHLFNYYFDIFRFQVIREESATESQTRHFQNQSADINPTAKEKAAEISLETNSRPFPTHSFVSKNDYHTISLYNPVSISYLHTIKQIPGFNPEVSDKDCTISLRAFFFSHLIKQGRCLH